MNEWCECNRVHHAPFSTGCCARREERCIIAFSAHSQQTVHAFRLRQAVPRGESLVNKNQRPHCTIFCHPPFRSHSLTPLLYLSSLICHCLSTWLFSVSLIPSLLLTFTGTQVFFIHAFSLTLSSPPLFLLQTKVRREAAEYQIEQKHELEKEGETERERAAQWCHSSDVISLHNRVTTTPVILTIIVPWLMDQCMLNVFHSFLKKPFLKTYHLENKYEWEPDQWDIIWILYATLHRFIVNSNALRGFLYF